MTKEKYPVLLTKAEAMEFAAERLSTMAADIKITELILGVVGVGVDVTAGLEQKDRDKLTALRASLVDVPLQMAACQQAADHIREIAREERLVAARAAAQGQSVKYSG